jgi:hypothetical protein
MHGPLNVKFDKNLLVKNNMWLNIFVNVHLLVYHVSIKHSLMNGNGTHEVHSETCLKRNLIITEISLAENFYISQSLESRGSTLQVSVLNGTCVQRKKNVNPLQFGSWQVSLYVLTVKSPYIPQVVSSIHILQLRFCMHLSFHACYNPATSSSLNFILYT